MRNVLALLVVLHKVSHHPLSSLSQSNHPLFIQEVEVIRTNPHNDQKARQESPEIDNAVSGGLHEVIGVCATAAYEVREGSDYVGCDNEEGEEVVPECGGEDDEEEAYC
jgi:hypothetical protein